MRHKYIHQLKKRTLRNIGNKADNLCLLIGWKYSVPITYICTWQAYMDYMENSSETLNILGQELLEIIDTEKSYAVRSSANVEDEAEYSYAGQFRTILDVNGIDAILESIQEVWASGHSIEANSYAQGGETENEELKMGVIIQEMVAPVFSGVSFSRNPTTGLDEVIVEAVQGTGESLVQEGVTPHRWVSKWGDWIAVPEQSDISLEVIGEVVSMTKAIANDYGKPVDLEWVYDGKEVYWVQLREITALEGINIYSNRISKEVLPGLIKPLVWSVNVPLVNSAWVRLFTELIGQNDIDPDDLAKAFYYQAYFNMAAIGQIFVALGMPRESLEVLMGIESTGSEKPSFKPTPRTYMHMPRMLLMALGKVRFSLKARKFIPKMLSKYREFHSEEVNQLHEDELLAKIDQLYEMTQETAYYNIVIPLLMQIYNRILKSQLSKLGVDYENFDLTQDIPELQELDPNFHLSNLNSQYKSLNPDLQARIEAGGYQNTHEAGDFRKGIDKFIQRFGHLSDSGNDFSSVPWREKPDLVVKMITSYTAPSDRAERVLYDDLEIPLLKRPLVKSIYRRARQFRLYRERIGSLYTFGYGLFRNYFLTLGDRLASCGIIEKQDDIFYLYLDEVKDAVNPEYPESGKFMNLVNTRRREMNEYGDLVLPGIIYGDQPPPIEKQSSGKLKGIPTSRGYYRGVIKVIRGMGEMDKLDQGDIMVIPFSDVGWTPLFSKAGAVIAESGGILSHSSIIAREYGIPGVVSVPGACQLDDGTIATVDGYTGEIAIHNYGKEQ